MHDPKITAKKLLKDFYANPILHYEKFQGQLKSYNTSPDFIFCEHNIVTAMKNDPTFNYRNRELLDHANWEEIKELIFQLVSRLESFNDFKKGLSCNESTLINLKTRIQNKSWDEAKKIVFRMTPASFLKDDSWIPDDAVAEKSYRRLFRVSKFGTYTDLNFIKETSVFKNCEGNKIVYRLDEVSKIEFEDDCLHCKNNRSVVRDVKLALGYHIHSKTPTQFTMFRGVSNPHLTIRHCDYVVHDKDHARDYIRGPYGVVLSKQINSRDLVLSKMPFGTKTPEFIFMPREVEMSLKKYGPNQYISYPDDTFRDYFISANQ